VLGCWRGFRSCLKTEGLTRICTDDTDEGQATAGTRAKYGSLSTAQRTMGLSATPVEMTVRASYECPP